MPVSITYSPKGDQQLWKDHPNSLTVAHHKGSTVIPIACLQGGMQSGRHSIMMKIPLNEPDAETKVLVEDDREPVIIVEISAREFLLAADTVRGWIAKDEAEEARVKAAGN